MPPLQVNLFDLSFILTGRISHLGSKWGLSSSTFPLIFILFSSLFSYSWHSRMNHHGGLGGLSLSLGTQNNGNMPGHRTLMIFSPATALHSSGIIFYDKSIDKRQQEVFFCFFFFLPDCCSFSTKKKLAAFYQLTYQHDSKDFNICNYIFLHFFSQYLQLSLESLS